MMMNFYLERIEDETGISGTGKVAEGVIFNSGKCALAWLTKYSSIAIYDSLEELEAIHGHNGKTRIVFDTRDEALTRLVQIAETLSDNVLQDVISLAEYFASKRRGMLGTKP